MTTHMRLKNILLSGLILSGYLSGFSRYSHAEPREVADSRAPILALSKLTSLQNAPDFAFSAAQLNTPTVHDFRTKAGTRVLFVAANELPIVDIRLSFNAGSARDNDIRAGLFGLASLTAQLLDEGTSTQSTDQIAAQFEAVGAEYGAAAYRDMFTVDLRSLSDTAYLQPATNQLLALLKDAQFPQSSIDRVFQNAAIGQRQREESPSSVASIRFWRELYGQHAYAEPSSGTQTSIKKITPDDLRSFKNRFLVAANLNIAITGQLSLKQAKALAEQISSSLPQGQAAGKIAEPIAATAARHVQVPFASSQSHIMIGQLGIRRDNPDLAALTVGNDILGGGDFNALLMKELREKRGFTYGAYSSFTAMQARGPFTISYSTRADQAAESVQIAKKTLQDFISQPPDPTAVLEAKQGILNGYPVSLSSNKNINGFLSMMGFYGLKNSYLTDYPAQVERVTASDIQRAFAQYIQPDKLLTVIVGQAVEPVAPVVEPNPTTSTTTAP